MKQKIRLFIFIAFLSPAIAFSQTDTLVKKLDSLQITDTKADKGKNRMTEAKHWPTDVIVGAAMGILSGRQVVNNYHRYMKIRQPERPIKQKKGVLSFSIQPMYGQLLPGITYSFY